jgi:hypothetical protein
MQQGIFPAVLKDRRGWRLFTEEDLNKIRAESNKIKVEEVPRAEKPGE